MAQETFSNKKYIDGLGASTTSTGLVYRALISQTGTSAPTAVILVNTLGEVPTFSYADVAEYYLTISSSLFLATKTSVITSCSTNSVLPYARRASDTDIVLGAYNATLGDGDDGVMSSVVLDIYIYE